jgi:hypothetical protein
MPVAPDIISRTRDAANIKNNNDGGLGTVIAYV